jgi:hypothetical protein
LREAILGNSVDDELLSELRTAPVTVYFGMFNRLNMSFSQEKGHDHIGDHSVSFFPYWKVSKVEDFRFYFSLGYQRMINMMLLNAIGAGILCHSDVEYFGMLSDANSKNMFEWTKEDRASFFNDTCKDENYKLLLVSS